ncbi:MAG: hypothetical protein N3A54_05015, partial [Patescibacteria group bacterium]|nr:hypothetical protein [Patescibacteria group bacterium]
ESTLIVKANILVKVLLSPRSEHISPAPTDKHLQATQYWQVTDPRIQAEAKRLKTVKNIYDFVVQTLEYNYEKINNRGERKGALAALEEPKNSVCTEFTDLFVALARAAGIPARQAVGYAYTTNPKLRPLSLVSDILHAWPEYYDEEKKRWIPVDPTWESTTGGIDYFQRLDFNHIVFAYNGIEDDYPYPAGFYRQAGKIGKDIDVRFHQGPFPQQSSSLVSIIQFPSRIFSEFTTRGTVLIRNTGNVGEEHASISVLSDDFDIAIQKDIPMIPPYGVVSIPFSVHPPGIFYGGERFIYTAVSGSTFHYRVNVTPLAYILLLGAVIVVWIFLILAIIIKKRK